MGRRIQRRRAVRTAAAALVILLAVTVAVRPWGRGPSATPSRIAGAAPPAGVLVMRYASFRVIADDQVPSVTTIDDDTLLNELRALGHPTGMIRTAGGVALTADVAKDLDRNNGGAG